MINVFVPTVFDGLAFQVCLKKTGIEYTGKYWWHSLSA